MVRISVRVSVSVNRLRVRMADGKFSACPVYLSIPRTENNTELADIAYKRVICQPCIIGG